jgi:hypothetical protein
MNSWGAIPLNMAKHLLNKTSCIVFSCEICSSMRKKPELFTDDVQGLEIFRFNVSVSV